MRIILAGGGTGGHLYPGIAVAEKLVKKGYRPTFLVSDRGIEKEVLTKLGYKFVEQNVTAFAGAGIGGKVISMQKLANAAINATRYIERGDKVLLLGGFAAAPAALASMYKGATLYIHEQNSVMGRVNKMMASQASKVFISYTDTKKAPVRSFYVGNPVRSMFKNATVKEKNGKNLLVLGGSSGSRAVNNAVISCAESLVKAGYRITHQTGKKLFDETHKAYDRILDIEKSSIVLKDYIEDMPKAYQEADLVISRSGSGSVFETKYSKRAALYIPFAQASDNHQYYNALAVKNEGYADIIEEKDIQPDTLLKKINEMFMNMQIFNDRLKDIEYTDSVSLILKGMQID